MKPIDPARDLAALLTRRRREIRSAWSDLLRELPGSHYQSRSADELTTWTTQGVDAIIASLETVSSEPLEAHAERVSTVRARLGFEIHEVVQGLLLLKEAALTEIADTYREDPGEIRDATLLLDRAVRCMLARFTARFAALNLAESRRLEQVTASFLDVRGLQEVLELICREIRALTGAARATVHLPDASGELTRVFSHGTVAAEAADPSPLTLALSAKSHQVGELRLHDLPQGAGEREARLLEHFADHAAAGIAHATYHEQQEKLAALEERQKLAHELHDSVTQSLYGVTMFAEAAARLQETGDHSKAGQLLRQMRDISLEALREMRLLLFDLRPPMLAEQGLVATIQARLSAVEGRAGVQTQLEADGVAPLPDELASGLYGICTEALNNSLKHARATRISVRLRAIEPTVSLEVRDDGRGFDPAAARRTGGMGLVGMEERAARLGARLSVTSRAGEGTRVTVEAPLKISPGHPGPREGSAP